MSLYANFNAIGLEDLAPEELTDRQWRFFWEELEDDDDIKKHIGNWDGEIADLGYQVLNSSEWIEWCADCLGYNEVMAIFLCELIRDAFEKYRGAWNE